jgi:hypothetical protein
MIRAVRMCAAAGERKIAAGLGADDGDVAGTP